MELQIFTPGMELAGVLDSFESLDWTSRYCTAGEFVLKAPLTPSALELLRRDRLVVYDGKSGYVETVELLMEEDGERVTATGRDLLGYLARRINWGTINWSGTAEGFLRKLVEANCISCADARIIPGLVLGAAGGFAGSISKQNSYGNLLEVMEEVATGAGLGCRIVLDAGARSMAFDVYQGADRRAGGPDPLIFSREMENILTQVYTDSANGHANTALIGGEGEGAARTMASITAEAGLGRYELYVDAKDIRSALGEAALTPEEYRAQLLQRGHEALAQRPVIQTMDGTVNHLARLSFGLGDLVTVSDPLWGVSVDTRITEIQEICENTGNTVNVILGGGIPTLTDKIRKGMI